MLRNWLNKGFTFKENMEYTMKFVNRSYLIVKPRQPYIDWVRSFDDSVEIDDLIIQKTIYLVDEPEFDSPEEINNIIKKVCRDIFVSELEAWYTDKESFPKDMTYKAFKQWFDVEYVDLGFDLSEYELIAE